jgi:hypothetical protein
MYGYWEGEETERVNGQVRKRDSTNLTASTCGLVIAEGTGAEPIENRSATHT